MSNIRKQNPKMHGEAKHSQNNDFCISSHIRMNDYTA